jgi:hypothetical protein
MSFITPLQMNNFLHLKPSHTSITFFINIFNLIKYKIISNLTSLSLKNHEKKMNQPLVPSLKNHDYEGNKTKGWINPST